VNLSHRLLTISLLFIPFSGLSATANERPVFKGIEGALLLGSQYDDNTNRYSEKYLDRFKNGEDPGRFHIVTFDDAIACAKLDLKAKFHFINKRQTILDGSAFYKMFANNAIDRYGTFAVGIGQQVARATFLHLTYECIPHYYLYHFRDKDWQSIVGNVPEAFQSFDYAKDAINFRALRYLSKRTSISLQGGYSRYFYNEHYTEYDSKRYEISLHGNHTINKEVILACNYEFGLNNAQGYDGDMPGETKQSSDDADDSFLEHSGGLGLQWYLPEVYNREHSLSVDGAVQYRDYTTAKGPETDRTHAGRFEYAPRVSVAYTFSLSQPLALQIEYRRIQRWAGSSYAENNAYIKEEKDYSKNIAAFTVQYAIGR
jgi:hypothetical protein